MKFRPQFETRMDPNDVISSRVSPISTTVDEGTRFRNPHGLFRSLVICQSVNRSP